MYGLIAISRYVQRDDFLNGFFLEVPRRVLVDTSWLTPFSVCKRYQSTPPPLPRVAVNNLWEMSNAGDLRLTEKNTVVGQKTERLFDSARCV